MGEPTPGEISVRVDGHALLLTKHEKVHSDLWDSIDSIKNRLPIWATMLIAILTAAVGALLGGVL